MENIFLIRSPMKLMMTMITPEWMLMKIVELVVEAVQRKRKREGAQRRKRNQFMIVKKKMMIRVNLVFYCFISFY